MPRPDSGTDADPSPTTPQPTPDPESDSSSTATTSDTPTASRRPRRTVSSRIGGALLALALVTGLVAVGIVGWTFATRSWSVGGVEIAGQQAEDQTQRDELMGVGRQFVLRLGSYGPEGLDESGELSDYRASVGELLTPAFENSFSETVPLVEAGVQQSGVARDAEVFATGVIDVESDRAAVLVAGVFNDTQDGEAVGQPVALRLQVELVRVEGEWLVDNFMGVQAPEEEDTPIDPDLEIPEPDADPSAPQQPQQPQQNPNQQNPNQQGRGQQNQNQQGGGR